MSGAGWPTVETKETLACTRCPATLEIGPEAEAPTEWAALTLACSTVYVCGGCIAEHGGSRRAVLRNAEDWHREKGGCVGCKA